MNLMSFLCNAGNESEDKQRTHTIYEETLKDTGWGARFPLWLRKDNTSFASFRILIIPWILTHSFLVKETAHQTSYGHI